MRLKTFVRIYSSLKNIGEIYSFFCSKKTLSIEEIISFSKDQF